MSHSRECRSRLCRILGNVVLDCVVLGCVVLDCVVLGMVVLDPVGVPNKLMKVLLIIHMRSLLFN